MTSISSEVERVRQRAIDQAQAMHDCNEILMAVVDKHDAECAYGALELLKMTWDRQLGK